MQLQLPDSLIAFFCKVFTTPLFRHKEQVLPVDMLAGEEVEQFRAALYVRPPRWIPGIYQARTVTDSKEKELSRWGMVCRNEPHTQPNGLCVSEATRAGWAVARNQLIRMSSGARVHR